MFAGEKWDPDLWPAEAKGVGLSEAPRGALAHWIVPLMGGDFGVRQWHHLMMWFFVVFALVHVYLCFYHDYVEGRGVISSMAGGWKFVEKRPRD